MCFYLAPEPNNTKLKVLYGSEAIWFGPYGKNKIYTDLIIENVSESNEDISSLLLLYPRGFVNYKKKKKKFHGHYEDVSYQWGNEDSVWTKYLKETVLWECFCENSEVVVTLKDYYRPDEKGDEIKGNVFYDPEALKIHPNFESESMAEFLYKINHSIFQLNFMGNPIKRDQKRFLRLYFEPINSTVNDTTWLHKAGLLFLNELYLNYYYTSPGKILYKFKERLFIGINPSIPNNPLSEFERGVLENIKSYMDNNIGDIEYQSWRLFLFPKKLRTLFNFIPTGNIEPLGGLMNYSGDPNNVPKAPTLGNDCKPDSTSWISPFWKKRSYDWGSYAIREIYEIENESNVSDHANNSDVEMGEPDIGIFQIFFTGKLHVRSYELLPWIILVFLLIITIPNQIISYLIFFKSTFLRYFPIIAFASVLITFGYFIHDIGVALRNYLSRKKK